MDFDDDELHTILIEQSRELPAAMIFESDLDLSFQIQMQEALKASVALHHSDDDDETPPQFQLPNDHVSFASLLAEDIARYERERSDRKHAEAETLRMRDDLGRRIHDQAFARDLSRIPDPEWAKTGDQFVRPYGQGSSSTSSSCSAAVPNAEPLRLYFKGLLREETARGKTTSAGVGIAICDMRDDRVLEMRKPLVCGGDIVSPEAVEVKALILGLEAAVSLGIKRLTVFCADSSLHQYVTGKSIPRQGNIATLVGQVTLLQRKFSYCGQVLVRHNDIKFALKLANEALVSQVTWPEAISSSENIKETCAICLEDMNSGKMFAINGCLHRYCYSCMKSHVHVKLVQGMLPKCPHEGCKTDLTTEMCKTFLTPELCDIMCQRVKESSIAATDKIYCPYPTCSALMSRIEVSANTRVGGPCRCKRCQGLFCLYCKVPWHNNMSCGTYKRSNPSPSAEDAKLKSLARKNLWRQCVKCSHMVELTEGCNHITCRCGHQFCYICGAEWRNKKATCACPLWDEQHIVHERNRQRQRLG
ncbi:E3 ubiquitin-protein ligase RSL1-like isoform X1 [Rhododendron vialii]|uniref:E3 ubiquitin-protein ligase RSL1-like isoform X1 n=1 Tax=Rhododendron vialii TaxID=182163 RepID=UPI00265F9FC2|nr:E3 ubiquitin-protein ligase RSL1-like isoform X1 [Rhododendron vialii]XP_058199703.1 E3 ubiquitin-protein ligase RSL1-like isoform X1 [Rhododendron vialii]